MPDRDMPLLQTKLHRPAPASDAVGRPRLLEALAEIEDLSLTLVCAPAGYGKSTVASQWVEKAGHPAGWVSLGERDNELASFVRYFVAAVRTAKPGACPASLAAVDGDELPGPEELAEYLINELLELDGRIIVVLDDFHRVKSPKVLRLLSHLVKRPLPTLHLVIVSRRDPQIALGSLRAAGRLQEIRLGALRFTPEESLAFLSQAFPTDPPDDLPTAIENLDGWPVALRLLLLRLREAPDPAMMIAHLPSIAEDVREYLVAEVMNHLPPARLSSLLRIAILDRFCAPLCEALSDQEDFDGREFLRWLSESGLFAISLDAHAQWFRFHHFFQEVLVRRLKQKIGETALGDLHVRASIWFEDEGLFDEAFEFGLKTPGCVRATDLIALPRNSRLPNEFGQVSGWLDRLPEGVAESRPGTLAAVAWRAVRDGKLADQPVLLERLEALLEEEDWDPREYSCGRADAATLRVQFLCYLGDYSEVVTHGREALEIMGKDQSYTRSIVQMFYAVALSRVGKPAESWQVLRDATTEMEDPCQAGMLYSTEAQIEALALNIPGLRSTADRYVAFLVEQGNESDQLWARYLAAFARYQANDLSAAREVLALNEEEFGTGQDERFMQRSLLAARILFAEGRVEEAHEVVDAFRFLMLEHSLAGAARAAKAVDVEFLLRRGEVSRCAAWFECFDRSRPILHLLTHNRFLTYLRVALALGTRESLDAAKEVLEGLTEKLGDSRCPHDEAELLIIRARLHESEGRMAEAVEDLGNAVAMAAPGGALRIVADHGAALVPLLQRLKLDQAGLKYVGRVMAIFGAGEEPHQPLVEALSKREFEVLGLLAQSHSNKEIATRLFISVQTVKRHVANIFDKLGVNRRGDAVAKAIGLGLLK